MTDLIKTIPRSRLVAVPNTTHYIQSERPDIVITAIRAATVGATLSPTP